MKEIEREFGKGKKVEKEEKDIWKGLDSFGDIRKEMDGFWDAVKGKEEKKKEMPIVIRITPKGQIARRGGKSGFWKK